VSDERIAARVDDQVGPRAMAESEDPGWHGFAAVIAGCAGAGAAALVGSPVGLGVSAVAWSAIGAAVLAAPRRGVRAAARRVPMTDARAAGGVPLPRRESWAVVWWVGAVALAAVPVFRSAGWVVWPALAGAAALASLAAAGGAHAREVMLGLTRVGWLPAGLLEVLRPAGAVRPGAWWRPALQGAGIGMLLLAVFVPLLASADAAFEHLLGEAVPDPGLDRPVPRLGAWLAVTAIGGALVRAGRAEPAPLPAARSAGRLDRLAWALPLLALVALLGAFVALQVTVLFAGHDHVVRTAGLTYAEYAREGFAQLMAAAALTLGVVAAAARCARRTGRADERLLRALLGCLCVLCLMVLASALMRLSLYEQAYGYTRARVTAQATMLWLGGVFALVLASGVVRRAAWLPRALVALSAGGLLAFAASDPDRRIAAHNIERYERTGRIDPGVLATLSPDAAPALAGLPPRLAECVTRRVRRDLAHPDGAAGLNLARVRARGALGGLPPAREGSCVASR
jgi:Domain of unknown function (DUF4173)